MKLYEVKGTGKLQGMTVMSLDAFVKGVKPKKEMDESDISGLLHAAQNYNRAFLITADLAEGGRKTYRVKAQSERIAREKFEKHYAMAKIVSVKEEGVAESQTAKSGIVQTEVYGTQAYHAKCMEPNCDWESKRYDKIQQAQAAAKKHAEQHFDKEGVAEGRDFDRCYDKACQLYDKAQEKNLQPELVQVADFKGDGSNADRRWTKLPQHVWQHYIVIVGDRVLDPTARQFGPDMPTQYHVSDLDRLWGKQYKIRPREGVAEAAKWRDPKYKDKLYTQEPGDSDDYDNIGYGYDFPERPENDPGQKRRMGGVGSEFDRNDPLVKGQGIGRSGIKHSLNLAGKRKGLPSRDQITSLKGSIKDAHGKHRKPNLPEQGVAEGSEFGAYYYEQLAQQTFDINPNLQDENEILNLGYKIAKGELGSRAQGVFRDEDFAGDFISAYNWLKQQDVTEDSKDGDRITIASQGKGYIVYHSFDRDAYTARGVGEWKGQIQPEWFYSLADAEDHAEMEISGHDEHYSRVDELTFKGSTCTKDCSGHEAGYNWYQRKGRVPNSHSKSFNKGADIAANESVNEAPGDFGLGANYRDIPDDEMQAFLDRTKNKEKTKRDKYDYPYVHASSVQIKNEEGREYDLDSLRKEIMTRPTSILRKNDKMQHSETGTEAIFDIGLPALKGLAVNEKTGQFVVVDTCPGAGACKTYCYAMKGSYVMFKAVSMGLARMLNFLLNDPEGFKNKLNAEIAAARSKMAKKGARVVVRWHDAGDFFSPEYLDMAYGVARDNPDVGFYAYTKIADVATGDRPKNFNMNFSQGALSGQEKKVDFKRVKHSKVVPREMFTGKLVKDESKEKLNQFGANSWKWKSQEDFNEFKTALASRYHIDKDSIITYSQMMGMPVGDEPKWNVIVAPGDGDNSANRNDVIGSYLLFH